jgi:predicted O-methyltransferase YrrM
LTGPAITLDGGVVDLRSRILSLAQESCSADLMKPISREMSGLTFHHHYHLLYDLRTLLGSGRKVYLEIGVFNGGSLALMMQHPLETELHGIDPLILANQVEFTFANISKFNKYPRTVTIHQKYSYDPELLQRLKGVSIDLLFVDGDHQGPAVIQDFELYAPLVSKEGFIVFDDYIDPEFSPEVRPAVDLIVERTKTGYYPGAYEVIGTLPNFLLADPADMVENSVFILRKKS